MFVLRKMPYLHKFFLQQSKNQEEPPQQFFMITTFVDMTKCSKNHSRATNSWQSGIYSKTKKNLLPLLSITASQSYIEQIYKAKLWEKKMKIDKLIV